MAGKETLILDETDDKLTIEFNETGKEISGDLSGSEMEYNVSFNGKKMLTFKLNSGSGGIYSNSISILNKDLIADFFSELTQNLLINGVSSLKNP